MGGPFESIQAKIDTLSQGKEATRIFCLSKYPAPPPSSTDYVPLFTEVPCGRSRGEALPAEPPAGRQVSSELQDHHNCR